jgi:hypothetical protein
MMLRASARPLAFTAALAVVAALAAHSAKADPAAPKSALECRAITDFDLRGQCWDSLDRLGLNDAKTANKRNFGLGFNGPSEAAIKPKKEPKPKAETADVEQLDLTLASVADTALGRLLLVSTDGAIWEQTDSDPVGSRPRKGDVVKVSKGFLGGYMCQVTRWQAVRCQRDE